MANRKTYSGKRDISMIVIKVAGSWIFLDQLKMLDFSDRYELIPTKKCHSIFIKFVAFSSLTQYAFIKFRHGLSQFLCKRIKQCKDSLKLSNGTFGPEI